MTNIRNDVYKGIHLVRNDCSRKLEYYNVMTYVEVKRNLTLLEIVQEVNVVLWVEDYKEQTVPV